MGTKKIVKIICQYYLENNTRSTQQKTDKKFRMRHKHVIIEIKRDFVIKTQLMTINAIRELTNIIKNVKNTFVKLVKKALSQIRRKNNKNLSQNFVPPKK